MQWHQVMLRYYPRITLAGIGSHVSRQISQKACCCKPANQHCPLQASSIHWWYFLRVLEILTVELARHGTYLPI